MTGSAGDTLALTVVSITNPDFQPDMESTSSYGWYHKTLDSCVELQFNVDAWVSMARNPASSSAASNGFAATACDGGNPPPAMAGIIRRWIPVLNYSSTWTRPPPGQTFRLSGIPAVPHMVNRRVTGAETRRLS